jgi:hypothetical protein
MLMSNVGFARLSDEARKDEAVKHAFAVHVGKLLYVAFFRLYKAAPKLDSVWFRSKISTLM